MFGHDLDGEKWLSAKVLGFLEQELRNQDF